MQPTGRALPKTCSTSPPWPLNRYSSRWPPEDRLAAFYLRLAQGAVALKLKRLVPETVRRWRQVLSLLNRDERRALLDVVAGTLLQPGSRDWRPAVRGARTVLFVCHGNIIRSPFAAAALGREAASRDRATRVTSAGLAARPGEPADPRAIDSAEERGLSLEKHGARRLNAEQVEAADAIFVMDHMNLGRLLAGFPRLGSRVFLLGGCQVDGRMTLTEIRDPVCGTPGDIRAAHDQILASVRRLAAVWDQPAA